MRLIDADDLDVRDVSPCYGSEQMGVTDVDIENAPTIEAIPISVIKDEMFRLEKCQLYDTANYLGYLLAYWELVMKGEEDVYQQE